MKVTIQQSKTVGEILGRAREKYGSVRMLKKYVAERPQDMMAKLALHDWTEYEGEDPSKVIHETREVIIPDSAIDQLTVQRLQLLLTLKSVAGTVASARALARTVHRDIKNVSEDVRVLSELGLLDVEAAGKGKPTRISLPGDQIDLRLVGAEG